MHHILTRCVIIIVILLPVPAGYMVTVQLAKVVYMRAFHSWL